MYVGDVVGIGLLCKFVMNFVLWYMGIDILNVFNKCIGGVCIGGKIVLIFFNIMEDSGVFFIEMDVKNIYMGDVIDIFLYEGLVKKYGINEVIIIFFLKSFVLLDEI